MFKDNSEVINRALNSSKKGKWRWLTQIFGSNLPEKDVVNKNFAENDEEGKENTQEMLVNLRNLQSLRLDDISVPKADIIAISDETSFEDVIEVFRNFSLF